MKKIALIATALLIACSGITRSAELIDPPPFPADSADKDSSKVERSDGPPLTLLLTLAYRRHVAANTLGLAYGPVGFDFGWVWWNGNSTSHLEGAVEGEVKRGEVVDEIHDDRSLGFNLLYFYEPAPIPWLSLYIEGGYYLHYEQRYQRSKGSGLLFYSDRMVPAEMTHTSIAYGGGFSVPIYRTFRAGFGYHSIREFSLVLSLQIL